MPLKRKLILCRCPLDRKLVRRETRNGVEHVIVNSATLPDDVVMNGGLYPADEIASSFHTLEKTLAPVEHPQDGDGNFISAADPDAIHNFHAGAWNQNVTRREGRVHHDIVINVPEALKTPRGQRLMDRINEFETNPEARPVHTSVGVFLEVEPIPEPKTNAAGDEYTWIARNMDFDHNAILLDSTGAATPEQGVGMAVNSEGEQIEVDRVTLGNEEEISVSDLHKAIYEALERSAITDPVWIEEIYAESVIFSTDSGLFRVPYTVNADGRATIVGIPIPVERKVTYPSLTANTGDDAMKDLILNALKEAGIETEGLDDGALFEAYNELQANAASSSSDDGQTGTSDDQTANAEAVANAIKPLMEKIEGLETKMNASTEAEKTGFIETITGSGNYPGLDAESAALLPIERLRDMAANCRPAAGIPLAGNADGGTDDRFAAPAAMPE